MSPGSVTTPPWYHLGQEETGESRGERIKSESPPKEKVPEKTTSGTRLDSFFFFPLLCNGSQVWGLKGKLCKF